MYSFLGKPGKAGASHLVFQVSSRSRKCHLSCCLYTESKHTVDFPGRVGLLTHPGNTGKGWVPVIPGLLPVLQKEEFVHVKMEELSRR